MIGNEHQNWRSIVKIFSKNDLNIGALCLLTAIAAAAALPTIASAESTICGDLNGDGGIYAGDSLLLLKKAVGQPINISCPGLGAGLACWDTNSNAVCDAAEDIDNNDFCDANDCKGPTGSQGPTGPAGATGPTGPKGDTGNT